MAIKIVAYPGQVNFLRRPSKKERKQIRKELRELENKKKEQKSKKS